MAANPQDESSETSPLLKQAAQVGTYVQSGEATAGPLPASNGLEGYAHVTHPAQDAGLENEEIHATEADTAGQGSGQYEGLPEVRKQLRYIIPAISIGVFLAAADQTLVASSAGKIGSDLNALKNTSWIATSYFLTLTSFQPLFGKLSDIFGRKSCLLSAYLIFAIGALWCGLSTSIGSLIAARAFAGIGGGGMTTCVSIMMSDIVPLRERGTWQGLINIIFAAGSGIGAPLGGFLSDTIGWKWAFIAQFPLCLAAFTIVFFVLKLPHSEKGHWREKIRRVDFLGAFTLVTAVTLLLIGLDQGSNVGWSSPVTVWCLVLSIPFTVGFGWVEARVASEPFAPTRVIFGRGQFGAYLCNFFSVAGWFGVLFYLPLFYQGVFDLNATQSGLRLLPGIIFGVTGSLMSGLIMQRSGKYFRLIVTSSAVLTLGALGMLLCTGPVMKSTLGISLGLAFSGLGNGSVITVSLIALLSNATVQDQAITTACSYLFRSLGSVLGLSIQSAVFQNLLRVHLHERLGSGDEAERLADRIRESLDYVRTLDPKTRSIVQQAYQESTTGVFGLIVTLAALSFFASLFIRERKLSN